VLLSILDQRLPGVNGQGVVRTLISEYYVVVGLYRMACRLAFSVARPRSVRQLNTASERDIGPEPYQLDRPDWTAQGRRDASSVTAANDVALTVTKGSASALTMCREAVNVGLGFYARET
jgi:hypothetical protein